MNSFRLRLALLVGAVTAALLLGTGYFVWNTASRFNLDRLDGELRHIGAANLGRVEDRSHWARLDDALAFVSGPDRPPAFAIWVKNYASEEYRSPGWPAGILPEAFPAPAAYEGGLTFATPPPPPRRTGISPSNPALPAKEPYFRTAGAGGSTWRVAVMGNPYTALVIAANLDEYGSELRRLRHRFALALPFVMLVVAAAAWLLASRAMRPVRALAQAAEGITEHGLDQRIAVPAHDRDFRRLVTVFNAMMDRLEKGFHQARRFSADASHELRTPIALLQAELEQALHSAPSGSREQQAYTSLLDEVQRLKAILEKLLLLSLADSGRLELRRAPADLSRIVGDIVEDCAALSPGVELEHVVPPGVTVEADAVLLEQALQNLTGNALKYNREGGLVRIVLEAGSGSAVVTVGNTGPGIAEADRSRVFERFYRGDPARSRDRAAGAGLGLSLSREILRAHGGDLALGRCGDDWTEFVATVPLSATPGAVPEGGGAG